MAANELDFLGGGDSGGSLAPATGADPRSDQQKEEDMLAARRARISRAGNQNANNNVDYYQTRTGYSTYTPTTPEERARIESGQYGTGGGFFDIFEPLARPAGKAIQGQNEWGLDFANEVAQGTANSLGDVGHAVGPEGEAIVKPLMDVLGKPYEVSTGLNPAGGGGGGGANVLGDQERLRQMSADVLSGRTAPMPGVDPTDKALQLSELDRIRQFQNQPQRQEDVISQLQGFLGQPAGPSAAEQQLTRAQDQSMSDALSLARSARGGPGAQARAMRVAQAENAATQATAGRDVAELRAKEEAARRGESLQALNQMGGLAGGIDANTLQALGLSSGAASDIRGQGLEARGQDVTGRGQTLNAMLGLEDSATGLTRQQVANEPAYLEDEFKRQYELTPQQKMLFSGLGAGSDLLSLFF